MTKTRDITVRAAAMADADAIASLCGQLGYPSTGADAQRRLAQIESERDAVVLVADSAGEGVIGWIHVRALHLVTRDACAEIGGLIVDESRRGRGIGSSLMAAAEDWARHRGLDVLRLRSNVIRDEAHTFYRRLGYESAKTSLLFTKTL